MLPVGTVVLGDCIEVMAGWPADSVDAVVCDPPYGLEFMGKAWDKLGAGIERTDDTQWAGRTTLPFGGGGQRVRYGKSAQTAQAWHEAWATAALRVAKPGAYLLAFGGTRTVHRMTCAIEDAGWIIRDMLVWAFASGFPKSRASLKPAYEPIILARKPGPLRDLNIDGCRIGMTPEDAASIDAKHAGMDVDAYERPPGFALNLAVKPMPLVAASAHPDGRWPSNVILTSPIFDGGWDGVVGGGESAPRGNIAPTKRNVVTDGWGHIGGGPDGPIDPGDSGTYSRFYLIPKAARSDREPVLGGLDFGPPPASARSKPAEGRQNALGRPRGNSHPTVKPTELMRHLVRLVTPPGGTVLDPFLGSGTTALAAEQEGFAWIGIEKEASYVEIAEARLNGTQRGLAL